MRFNINLATQPYEDTRRFLRDWIALLVLVTVVTALLVYAAASRYAESSEARSRIAQVRREIQQLEREREQVRAQLDQPQNREIRDQSRFLNQLIARKAFSWTQIFADLEQIMPRRIHVVSIQPEITRDNRLQIRMRMAGSSREAALELLRRMEQSKSFHRPEVRAENLQARRDEPVELEIAAQYVPQFQRAGGD